MSMISFHDLEVSRSDKVHYKYNKYKYKLSMLASRDVCIYFGKKTWSYMHCSFYLYKEFTRYLNLVCFESVVPAIFLRALVILSGICFCEILINLNHISKVNKYTTTQHNPMLLKLKRMGA